ncbi:hypothetical protein, partial [Paracoccus shanxieyensis]
RSRNPKLVRRSTVTASVTNGRALRYAEGSARGLLHHVLGHCLFLIRPVTGIHVDRLFRREGDVICDQ